MKRGGRLIFTMFGCLDVWMFRKFRAGILECWLYFLYVFISKESCNKAVIKVSRNKERKIQQIRYTFVCVHTRPHTSTSVHTRLHAFTRAHTRLQRNAKSGMNCVNCINRIQQHKLDELNKFDELTVYKRARTHQDAFQF